MSQRRPAVKNPKPAADADAALQHGALSHNKRFCREQLPFDRVLLKADGKDIVKKSSARKGRYLLVFAAQLASLSGGKLGSLAQLDTQQPVMYVDFPQGRLKFAGQLIFPKNKYMIMRAGHKEVLCEDIFDMVVVFSTAHWIGKMAENKDEHKSNWPNDILHTYQDGQLSVFALPSPIAITGRARSRSKSQSPRAFVSRNSAESDSDASLELAGMQAGPSQPSQRSSARKAASKRPRYAESSSSEGSAIESNESLADRPAPAGAESDSEADAMPCAQPASKRRKGDAASGKPQASDRREGARPAAPRQRPAHAKAAVRNTAAPVIALLSDDDDDDVEAKPAGRTAVKQPSSRPGGAEHYGKPTGKQTNVEGVTRHAVPEGDKHHASQATPASQRPGRAAKTAAGKRLQAEAGSDSEEASRNPQSSSENDDYNYDA